ncbi:MAG: bifunctional metallophosphatase/5'-nucleotidase [Deltaproteobacteria bacterium]|nr:bifunctional metallophosphatase/5'-nucleotidase [Deltaproteobacteria bacterium]
MANTKGLNAKFESSLKYCVLCCFFFIGCNNLLFASEQRLTILHTNDLHSHFLGFSPNEDYTPLVVNNDKTIGGWARIASVIKSEKAARDNPVLVLDAGDFLMGSLFHMVSREVALELMIMKEMGYDVITLGNHEFDLKPEGLARIIESAAGKSKIPAIVSSNLIFNDTDDRDDLLEEQFELGRIKPYVVRQKDGLKIGLFGLVGEDAASVAPFAKPVTFGDMVETSKEIVKELREKEQVDLVICLSHSGLDEDPSKSEDLLLAREVPGIDIIVSGHTHTRLPKPIVENNTIIVQAWAYGKQVGVLDVVLTPAGLKLDNYEYVSINDTIQGDKHIHDIISDAVEVVNEKVLQSYGLKFDQVLVETAFDLYLREQESNLGNLITDATRWAVDRAEYDPDDPATRVVLSIQSNGVIRDDILKGETGAVTVSDLFRTVPLGIGWDGTMSYPLVSFYVTASELKKTLEILTTVYRMKGSDYFLQLSGVKMTYNPRRMLFDRVTNILIENDKGDFDPLDYSNANSKRYKAVTNIYNATFLKVIGGFTSGILTIVPKDKAGNPIEDLTKARVDGDTQRPGIQEIKDWTALMDYVRTFGDSNGNGIPDIPEKYRSLEGRQTIDSSINPVKLLAGGNYLTWIAAALIMAAILFTALLVYIPVRIVRKKRVSI